MRQHKKNCIFIISMLGIIIGRILNRLLSKYFGNRGVNVVAAGGGAIVFCAIAVIIVMGYYFEALILMIMSIPLVVGGVGMYIDNMDIVGLSILLMFIIYPILIVLIPKLRRKKY